MMLPGLAMVIGIFVLGRQIHIPGYDPLWLVLLLGLLSSTSFFSRLGTTRKGRLVALALMLPGLLHMGMLVADPPPDPPQSFAYGVIKAVVCAGVLIAMIQRARANRRREAAAQSA